MDQKKIKRLSQDKNYNRPKKTYQESLSNQDIKEKLKDYKPIPDITHVSIGNHIRYFSTDPKTNEKVFRLGGTLTKVDPEGRYVILSNDTVRWSVQIKNTTFFQKMNDDEVKEEIKKEIKKEILTEENDLHNDLKKEIKDLKKKLDHYEKEYKSLLKVNDELNTTINKIQKEIKKEKNKK